MSIGIFVDYENIHHSLRTQYNRVPKPDVLAQSIVDKVRELVPNDHIAIASAYADWEAFEATGIQSGLKKYGIDPKYVLGKHSKTGKVLKNATDISMALDIYESVYEKSEIETFIIVSGDRDYLDLIIRLKRKRKHVFVFAVFKTTTHELFHYIPKEHFVALEDILFPQTEQPSLLMDSYKDINWKEFIIRVDRELQGSPGGFLAFTYLRDQLMVRWFNKTKEERQDILNQALSRELLVTDKRPNPQKEGILTTICLPNRENPLVNDILKEQKGEGEDFSKNTKNS